MDDRWQTLDAELGEVLANSLRDVLPALVAASTESAIRSDRVRLLLQLSMRNVGAARIGEAIAGHLDDVQAIGGLASIVGGAREHWAQAALSLGVEDALAALDLCAAAAHVLTEEPLPREGSKLWDVEDLVRRRPALSAPLRDWCESITARPEYAHLVAIRHALVLEPACGERLFRLRSIRSIVPIGASSRHCRCCRRAGAADLTGPWPAS